MTGPAARLDVSVRCGSPRGDRLHVIELRPKAVAAVDAHDPVEFGGLAELERDRHLDRYVAGPALEPTQVLAVEYHAVQKSVLGNRPGDLG